ncbi:MAG TPA: hypothetical protein ENG99_00905 [bacterium]|nr:hypothetical protein [bacterium]
MKKIKLVGIKKGWLGRKIEKVVADVYVKNGKIVVESKYKKDADKLQKELNKMLANKGGLYLKKSREKRDKSGELLEHVQYIVLKKPDDPEFSDALRSSISHEEFGDYTIYPGIFRDVEE